MGLYAYSPNEIVPAITPAPVEAQQLTLTLAETETHSTAVISTHKCPRSIIFYGDSRLGVLRISFMYINKKLIGPCYVLVNATFQVHTAQWGLVKLFEVDRLLGYLVRVLWDRPA